eukprot:145803-Ditylum_brightwellii.AAC.1
MRATLHHSYEELQQQHPGYVWSPVPFKKKGKLGPKLKSTGKLTLYLVEPSWKADPTCHTKVITKRFFNL